MVTAIVRKRAAGAAACVRFLPMGCHVVRAFACACVVLLTLQGCVTPTTSAGAAVVEIVPLANGVWLHRSYYTYPGGTRFPSNGLIVRDGETLTLLDSAWGELATVALLAAIDEQMALPVARAIITHAHGDRIAGADVLEARGITVSAHPLTRRFAIASGLPVPDHALEQLQLPGSSMSFGRIEIFYPGAAHTADNLVAWIGDERVLFGGCALRAAAATSAGNVVDAEPASWLEAIAQMQARYGTAAVVVPGHGDAGGVELLSHTARLVAAAIAD